MNIPFNRQPVTNTSAGYMLEALRKKGSGDGEFTKKCSSWMQNKFNANHVLLTTSGSHALDMAAVLCGVKPGDEVIMPSFTFSSTANAFVARGAKIVFVDIRPDTMNIDENLIEDAITEKTRVIVPVHYAGVACEMDTICAIAAKHNLFVVEDAAQGVMAYYKGKALGTIGDFNCYSFHDTKNYSMGEGGAILIKDSKYLLDAEIIREKGTNRSRFFRGEIDKYSWVDWGSSYLPSDINAAYLWSQLEIADEINSARLKIWNQYYEGLSELHRGGYIQLPYIPAECTHNAHMFYLKTVTGEQQENLLKFLKSKGISAVFHYVPLHSSTAGQMYGRFRGQDKYTTHDSSRLIRLPMYYGLTGSEAQFVTDSVVDFFE